MKKIIIAVFLITMITAGVFCQTGTIRELSGEVELKHAGSSSFVKASAGDTVARDTIVSTGFRSTAVIAIGSSVITVRPLTRLSLAEIQSADNTESVNVNLQAGRVRVEVKPPAGTKANFSVQSPSATASVRGTTFESDTDNVKVRDGKVTFKGKNGPPVIVTTGGASGIGKGGIPKDPVTLAEESTQPPAPVGTPGGEMVSQPTSMINGEMSFILNYGPW